MTNTATTKRIKFWIFCFFFF